MAKLSQGARALQMKADFEDGMSSSEIAYKHRINVQITNKILASQGIHVPDEGLALASSLDAYNAVRAALFPEQAVFRRVNGLARFQGKLSDHADQLAEQFQEKQKGDTQ